MTTLDDLKESLAAGRISRRAFMEGAIALGAGVAAAETMMGTALAAAPRRGGHLRQGLTGGASTDTLDPAKILDTYMEQVSMGQLRNNLTEIGPDNKLRPELAESWEASKDAATWTFKLRKGVEFHSGKPLEAADIVATFQHHMGPKSESGAKGIVRPITNVKADGKDTVVFTLEGGNADFPYLVSDYHLGICPAKADGTMDWQSGDGTGGYKLVKFEPGVNTQTTRNPNYWKPNAAWFDSIENLFIPDVTARTSALISGKIDVMSNLELKTVSLLEKNPRLKVFQTYGNKHAVFPMMCDRAPFTDNHVRLAMKYAIDRKEILKTVLRGYGQLGNDSPVGPANIYRATAAEMPQRHFDADKVRFHLKKAKLSKLSVQLWVANTAFEGAVSAASLFQQSAAKAGVNIKLTRAPDDGYWSNIWLVKSFCAGYWGGRPTEDWIFSQVYAKGADWNESHWDNAEFNKLLIEARAELDTAKRREMYVRMQQLVNQDGGTIIPMFMSYTQAVSSKIGLPAQIASNWELDGQKSGERWWFAA